MKYDDEEPEQGAVKLWLDLSCVCCCIWVVDWLKTFLNFQQFTLKAFSAQMTHCAGSFVLCPLSLVLTKATMI